MNCYRHGISMVKDTLTGIFTCFRCEEEERIFESLPTEDILEAFDEEELG